MISFLDDAHVEIMLMTHHVGHLACCLDGAPYIVPITYVYEDGCVYGHTREGEKVRIMRQNPRVCFEVDEIHDLGRWRSVVARGTFEELSGPERIQAAGLLASRLAPYDASETALPDDGFRIELGDYQKNLRQPAVDSVIYRIKLQEKSGRFERR